MSGLVDGAACRPLVTTSLISYVLNADSDRYADVLVSYTRGEWVAASERSMLGEARAVQERHVISSAISSLNEAIVDIRHRPRCVTAPGESVRVYAAEPDPCCHLTSRCEYTPLSRRLCS